MLAALLMTSAAAQSMQMRLQSVDGPALADELELEGFDVLRGAVTGHSVEVVVSEAERDALEERGLAPALVRLGQPLAGVLGYPDLERVIARLHAVAESFPEIARVVDLTDAFGVEPTFEGRHLFALLISDHVDVDEAEPATQLLAAHHAREVLTPVIALHVIERLTSLYGVDPRVTAVVDGHEIWIAPVWNPDGYAHVFAVDDLWRKNRRVFDTGIGVDLNRNYDFGWRGDCPGSGRVQSSKYRGPEPASEAETRTQVAFSDDRQFAKVLELHSFAEAVLWGYSCSPHPFDAFLQDEAIRLSGALGYGGAARRPSAEGEHFEWQIARHGSLAMLVEAGTAFHPPVAEASGIAQALWPGILEFLERPIPVHGTVNDAVTGEAVAARMRLLGVAFERGEILRSGGPWGRYHLILPPGDHRLAFSAPGYAPFVRVVHVTPRSSEAMDVMLWPAAPEPVEVGCGCTAAQAGRTAWGWIVALWILIRSRRASWHHPHRATSLSPEPVRRAKKRTPSTRPVPGSRISTSTT